MSNFLLFLYGTLTVLVIAAFVFVAVRLRGSAIRISRSIDPIAQKAKTLKIEVSALKHSRLDRQRRLEDTGSTTRSNEK
jgi:hypothetical protein